MRGAADMDPGEDIAPKRTAEPRPRRRYRELIETADGILWESDPSGQRFTFVSPRAEELLGYAIDRWLSESDFWLTIVDPDDRIRAHSLRSAILSGNGGTLEYRARSTDGTPLWLRETVRIARDRAGRPFAARGMIVDVTDLKQAEDVALRLASILEQNGHSKVVPLEVRRAERQQKGAAPDARASFLAEIARQAPTQRDPRALAAAMLRHVVQLYSLDVAVVTLERFDGTAIVASWPEVDAPRPHADCDIPARMEDADDVVVVPPAAMRCPEITREMSSLLIVPLKGDDARKVGAIAVATRREEGLSDADRAELRWYAGQMGPWLAFATSYQTLAATSTLDALTGLLTRDAFYLRFEQEVSRATRSEQRLALLRWSIADAARNGARAAEVAVRAFAEVLKAELRPYDVVARVGAHDFAALVFVRNHEVAHNIAGRVQQRSVRTSIGRGKFLDVPARGFALFPDDGNQLEPLDRIAEVRLSNHRDTRRALTGNRGHGRAEPQAAG